MDHLKKFWPLAIPFVAGVSIVAVLLTIVRGSVDSAMGASIGVPLVAVGIIVAIAKQWRISFPLYALLLFVTLLPVAYFQVNAQTSLMPMLWVPLHIAPSDIDGVHAAIAVNAGLYLASFAVLAAGSYAFCRRWI